MGKYKDYRKNFEKFESKHYAEIQQYKEFKPENFKSIEKFIEILKKICKIISIIVIIICALVYIGGFIIYMGIITSGH